MLQSLKAQHQEYSLYLSPKLEFILVGLKVWGDDNKGVRQPDCAIVPQKLSLFLKG